MKLNAGFLNGEALIHLRGNAVPEFLQGQLSCDTRLLDDGRAVAGAFCNVKGRVLSDLLIVRLDSAHCLLRLRASVAESIVETLGRYAQFSRISVELEAREHCIAAVLGKPEALQRAFPDIPAAPGRWQCKNERLLLRRSASQLEIICLNEEAAERVAGELATLEHLAESRWQSATLLDGHYAIEASDTGLYTPQALNYDLTGLVAFDKGCYTGQEVIARLHYKGRSKRRLQVLHCADENLAAGQGAAVLNALGESVGKVLRIEEGSGNNRVLAAEVSTEALATELQLETGTLLQPVEMDDAIPSG